MEKHLRHLPILEKGEACLNCGHNLVEDDNFCPRCGQINSIKRVTFIDMIKETLGDFIAYDSRLSNSLIPLFKKPGQLSLDYISGKRASHIHPMRLYLVVSFVFFLLNSIDNIQSKYFEAPNADEELTFNGSTNSDIYSVFDTNKLNDSLIDSSKENKLDRFVLFLLDIKENGVNKYESVTSKYELESSFTNKLIYTKAVEYSTFTFDKLGEMLSNKLPIIAFLFLPVFVIFLNLIHRKRDILYLEHLIFAFNTQSLLFILLAFATLIGLFYDFGGDIIEITTLFIVFPIYLFLALKKFYNYNTNKKAVLMFIAINTIYIITATLTLLAGILFTFFTY
ncbi:MAG: DUF3667 domain-containing protein [Flavobacteriales bacterium]|nr:DUF3667 domain-containing protein [Flavobacteriales bacterium]